jgi:hypothetical protein
MLNFSNTYSKFRVVAMFATGIVIQVRRLQALLDYLITKLHMRSSDRALVTAVTTEATTNVTRLQRCFTFNKDITTIFPVCITTGNLGC